MTTAPTFGRRGASGARRPSATAPRPAAAAPEAPRATMADLLARTAEDSTPLIALRDPAAPQAAQFDETDIATAVGPNWEAYRLLWLDMASRPALRPGFAIAPLLLQGLWLLYRRQYAAFFGLVALTTGVLFIAPDFRISALVFFAGVALTLGFFGRSLVLLKACHVVAEAQAAGLGRAETEARIARRGGVDRISPIVAMLFLTGVVLAIFFHAAELVGAA